MTTQSSSNKKLEKVISMTGGNGKFSNQRMSSVQAYAIKSLEPSLADAVKRMKLPIQGPLRIADFGCSTGSNSISYRNFIMKRILQRYEAGEAAGHATMPETEDDLKNADTFDVSIGGPGTLAEFSQLSRDADFAPGQVVSSLQQRSPGPGLIFAAAFTWSRFDLCSSVHLVQQRSPGPGLIGSRRSMTDLGAIGDNLIPALGGGNASGQHDQLFNSQALEAAYRKLPLPKDSE
ncbi:hypothetical protein CY35_05G100500 [Sphagnum magellanicum]|nr:hypothetical protein CY35_05G100500 [Sphagnum magellanicum]